MTDLKNRPIHFDEQFIQLKGGYGYITCERVTEEISVHPQAGYTGGKLTFTGLFTVGVSCGLAIPFAACIHCTRTAAQQIAAIQGVDWDDTDAVKNFTPDQEKQFRQALGSLQTCDITAVINLSHED